MAGTAFKLTVDGTVATLTLSRPAMMNALGEDGDGDAFAAICETINDDRSVRALILTGEGNAFSAGGNVKAMDRREGIFAGSPADIRQGYRQNIHKMLRALYGIDVPVIAAINGPAIGLGCDLACLADIRIAAEQARFGVTFLKIGLIPGDGGAWILPRLIGMSRAAELLYTGRIINAETALDWGLVSRIVPADALMDTAKMLAEEVAAQPPQALRAAKMLLRQGQATTYDAILELSASTQAIMHATQDHAEGVAAVIARRPPNFSGN